MKIAAQLYTTRDYQKDIDGFRYTIKRLSEIGYKSVQLSTIGDINPAEAKKILDMYDMEVCATHYPPARIINDTQRVIEEHKLYNCGYVGLGQRIMTSVEEADAFLQEIIPAAQLIYDSGLKFVYHNHHHEFFRIDKHTTVMDYILEKTSPSIFGLLPDLYWLQSAGIDPKLFIRTNKERIDVVHFKDMVVTAQKSITFGEIFEGNMDYEGIYNTCVDCGVKYAAIEQDRCEGNPFDSLAISFNNLKARGMV